MYSRRASDAVSVKHEAAYRVRQGEGKKIVNSKQQKKGDRGEGGTESTAALSLCLLIQTPQENTQQRLLSLAELPANHGSGMQGAFRLYPTPKYERERERKGERGMLWCRGSSSEAGLHLSCILWCSSCWSEYITVNKLQASFAVD